MELDQLGPDAAKNAQEILGYLNFSSGAPDPGFSKNLNDLFGLIDEARQGSERPTWRLLGDVLGGALGRLRGSSDAFRQVDQAEAVLRLVFEAALPGYRQFHADLLFHQTDESLFRPLFVGQVCEAVLRQGGPWDETDRIVDGAVAQLNDFLGYRPVAVLESDQKIQPYAHEYVRPIPLFIRSVGVAVGAHREVVRRALAILEQTDPTLLFQAWFDPEMLDELAVDPRAYDFDHPVNKRPNYLFGQWDLHKLDNSGRCRRFVLQEVALEAMIARIEARSDLPREELLFEAAAVLAGTMLMGAGVSGNRPDAHDSSTTLATLVQHIAVYRDTFYEQLIGRLSGRHAKRLQAEAVELRQPFGGARQEFNQYLARRRAEQLQHVSLAQFYSRIGYLDAAAEQVDVVPVASARMKCDIQCRLTAADLSLQAGQLDEAAALLPEVENILYRAIECGAMVDPWNVLGFGGQYSLFPALENSIPDHRVDELVGLIGEVFNLYVRLQKGAAAAGDDKLRDRLSDGLTNLAQWWDKFATTGLGEIESISGEATRASADHVATALRAWHEAGTAAGDLAFWRSHVEQFRSPKAYALVVEALLEQRDPVAAMALLVQWLSRAEEIPLAEENHSFCDLALRWMEDLWRKRDETDRQAGTGQTDAGQRWDLSRKFLDYLEANAEEYWEVPDFELAGHVLNGAAETEQPPTADGEDGVDNEDDNVFGAAYEGVTYRDSTDDGFDGEILDGGVDDSDFELTFEAERIIERLSFLTTLANLWRLAAAASAPGDNAASAPGDNAASAPGDNAVSAPDDNAHDDRDDELAGWLRRATANRAELLKLLAVVHRYPVPDPQGTLESLVEYDRRRGIKDMLTEQIIAACVETADAGQMIWATMHRQEPMDHEGLGGLEDWEEPAGEVFRAVIRHDTTAVNAHWQNLIETLLKQPLLYVALARGGDPQRIVSSRTLQRTLCRLLACLPRLGLLYETAWLIETAQDMELNHPVGPGAITEFDRIFQIGCQAIARCLTVSSEDWEVAESPDDESPDDDLIELLERTTEALLQIWLAHSQGVRLSILETISGQSHWPKLKRFIERYGDDLFTQHFMNFGNLRGILHQGVDAYVESLLELPDADERFRMIADLDGPLQRGETVGHLEVILEAIVENYAEYIDYNSTTTQSDRGEMLYAFLDFLRLSASYDRVAWNLKPVVIAHEVIVRRGHGQAARIWHRAVARRTAIMADDHLARLERLTKRHGMRLPSVAERLGQRFVRPLAIDR
ncbi:MAG: hypothetical protein HQ567_01890, partial [Candidatus Nealsonbacteria bacterium]|nr:hypothetical protein [Candidatus Nealsonbacteria bacterium]